MDSRYWAAIQETLSDNFVDTGHGDPYLPPQPMAAGEGGRTDIKPFFARRASALALAGAFSSGCSSRLRSQSFRPSRIPACACRNGRSGGRCWRRWGAVWNRSRGGNLDPACACVWNDLRSEASLSANFAISNPVVTEALSAVFDVTYTGGGSGMVMAGYNTRNGNATSPADFSSTGGMLQFMTPGTTQQVSVTTSTDMLVEGSENFYLDLFDPMTGASLGTGTCTLNDPAAPHIGVTSNGGAVPNGSGSVDYGTVVVGQT